VCDRKFFSLPSEKISKKIVKNFLCDRGLKRRFKVAISEITEHRTMNDLD